MGLSQVGPSVGTCAGPPIGWPALAAGGAPLRLPPGIQSPARNVDRKKLLRQTKVADEALWGNLKSIFINGKFTDKLQILICMNMMNTNNNA